MIKLSEIKKMVQKRIIIENGIPKWEEQSLNGEIIFNELTEFVVNEINTNIIQELKGEETEEEISYKMIPYLVNLENDITLDEFKELMQVKNPIILMLYEGIIQNINDLFEYAENVGRVQNKEKNFINKIPVETIEDKIIRLTKEMENEKDTKKKKVILLELAKLYEKVDNNG